MNENYVDYLRSQAHRPLVVAGSGPSLKAIDYHRFPQDPVIFRANWFFLEDKRYLGTNRVDAWVTNAYADKLSISAFLMLRDGHYSIGLNLSYFPVPYGPLRRLITKEPLLHLMYKEFPAVEKQRRDSGLNPTAGIGLIFLGALLGFRSIYLAGMDFYQSTERYAFSAPDPRWRQKNWQTGYTKFHSLENELKCLELLRQEVPELQIMALCPTSFAATVFPLAPVLDNGKMLELPDNSFRREDYEAQVKRRLALQRCKNIPLKILKMSRRIARGLLPYGFVRFVQKRRQASLQSERNHN